MIMMIVIFLLLGLIEHVSLIQCYTCYGLGYCSLPLNFDGDDESNENDIEVSNYDPEYACLSDHSYNPITRKEKIILRGVKDCKEVDIPNHRVHCCYENYCNKQMPQITFRTLSDEMSGELKMESSSQRYISSIVLIIFSLVLLN